MKILALGGEAVLTFIVLWVRWATCLHLLNSKKKN